LTFLGSALWAFAGKWGVSSRENGIAERPQALRYPEIIKFSSAIYAQSNAERI
jgi:hypothetical protein